MKRYVGIDVAQKECAFCIVDDTGTILFEGSCATDPDEIVRLISSEVDDVEKIVHESGPLSIWLTRQLVKRGAPIVCIDARAAHKVLEYLINRKSLPGKPFLDCLPIFRNFFDQQSLWNRVSNVEVPTLIPSFGL